MKTNTRLREASNEGALHQCARGRYLNHLLHQLILKDPELSALWDLLLPSRLTHVVDVGANPIEGQPPYTAMLTQGLCQVTGFEPQPNVLLDLQKTCGPNERYLPYAVGDGGAHTLNICGASGMTSLLTPDPVNLQLFDYLRPRANVVECVPLRTRRLDDIGEIQHLDFLHIDIQGSELAAFRGGRSKLAECVAIQTEVSFVTLYENQPPLGEVDLELRSQGFIPHCFAAVKRWAITPFVAGDDPRSAALNQLLEADIVYVRDFARADAMTDEQLKHLALIAHHCYRSFDLTLRCVVLLEDRRAVGAGGAQRYLEMIAAEAPELEVAAKSIVQPAHVRLAVNADPLLTDFERNPDDAESICFLAQTFFDAGDFVNARKWYARRVEMGGGEEQIYSAMFRVAESMVRLDTPWPEVQHAYLKAWEFRPTRAEPLYAVARRCRVDGRYRLGYLFAQRASHIPLPEEDSLFVGADVYAWRASDEQAVCASWLGKHAEAFTLCRRLLARPDIPDNDRQRIAGNRDLSVPAMIEAALSYPDALVGSLVAGPRDAAVTVSLVAGPDLAATEQTLNSFLHCCTDVTRVGRFLALDSGLPAQDRATLEERYGFLEFADPEPGDGPNTRLARIREHMHGRFWLHVGDGWRFFAPENFITRLTAVLDTETRVFQVGINFADAGKLTGTCATEQAVRRTPNAGRYVLTDVMADGPAMFDTARLDQAGGIDRTDPDPIARLRQRAAATALHTASLDEVLCIAAT
jgi:FkbM family methyltransferase